MKNLTYISVILLLFTQSCKTAQNRKSLEGVYNAAASDFNYSLILRDNGTFTIILKDFGHEATCEGEWTNDGDTVLLLCNEPKTVEETLVSGYISERPIKINIINEKKLQYKKAILIRK